MPRRDAEINRVTQRIDEDLISDLKQYPTSIKRWFVDNVFMRTFSYMMGFTEDGNVKKLKCTAAGVMKVAAGGSGFEFVEVKTGIAGATESTNISFSSPVSRIRVVSTDYDMLIRPSRDGVVFQDQIMVFAGRDFQLDLVVHSFRVQRFGINDAIYRIEGYR